MASNKLVRRMTRAVLLCLLSVWLLRDVPMALAWSVPQKLPNIPYNVYRPKIAGEGNRFHVIFQQADDKVLYYSRGTAANGRVVWEQPRVIASNIDSQQDWDIAADETGTLHVAYSTSGNQLRYLKNTQHGDASAWSLPEVVRNLSDRVNLLSITLDAALTPYIAWGSGIGPSTLLFAYRIIGGWDVRDAQLGNTIIRNPRIVVAGSGDAAVVHVVYEVKRRSVSRYFNIGYTRGSRNGPFNSYNFSESFGDTNEDGLPNIALDRSDGTLYAVYVGGKNLKEYPLKFTSSSDNGQSWSPATKISVGTNLWVTGQKGVPPLLAAGGLVSLLIPVKQWDGNSYASSGLYATEFTRSTRQFSKPTAVLNPRLTNRKNNDAALAINQVARTTVWISGYIENIYFSTDTTNLPPPTPPDGDLVLNNGQTFTTTSTIPVAIFNLVGDPTQMRVAVDAPLSDAIPLQPFQDRFTLTIPAADRCEHTVAVELINGQGVRSQSDRLAARVVIDTAVQARVVVGNPYRREFNTMLPDNAGQTVTDGDAGYTRENRLYLEVDATADCTGLKEVQIGATATTLDVVYQSYPISPSNPPRLIADLHIPPNTPQIGFNPLVVRVQDSVGNIQDYQRQIIYDPVPPMVVTSGTLEIRLPTSGPTILSTLVFSGNVVTDNLYPAPGFWGVWVANSRTPVTNPISDTTLTWSPVQASATSGTFSLRNWSLLSGIAPANRTPGDYYVYARFLDGAGNPTTSVLSSTVRLDRIVAPSVQLPVVTR